MLSFACHIPLRDSLSGMMLNMSPTPTEPHLEQTPSPEYEFPLWPYLDTLYRWSEMQPWFGAAVREAWAEFTHGVEHAPKDLPEVHDPDQHDRILRFLSWFHLDRTLSRDVSQTPLQRFLLQLDADLTPEGRAIFSALTHTRYGAFKVVKQFRVTWLEDLSQGGRIQLRESPLGDELQSGDLVVGRMYPYEGVYEGDPDLHIGHLIEWGPGRVSPTPPEIEAKYFSSVVPAKGGVMDVLDALLMQVDSPLSAEAVFDMMREAPGVEKFLDSLYSSPGYRLRYLHLRDRALFEELLQELWDTSGPLQDAQLGEVESTQLSRLCREWVRAVAEENANAVVACLDPEGLLPLYLELFGLPKLKRLLDVAGEPPDGPVRARHQLLPRDGGIFTTLSWGNGTNKHAVGLVARAQEDGGWALTDITVPEHASPALMMAFDKAQNLGWSEVAPPDEVEENLRRAVFHVGYSVHDTVDLFRLWREFKAAASPDLTQPTIWAAGVELADTRLRNENVDVKILAKSYRVMPRAIEQAADEIESTLLARAESQSGPPGAS